MNLLYIVPYAPTPIRTRPYNLLRLLCERGHGVTLATTWSRGEDRMALGELTELGVRVIATRLSGTRKIWNMARTLPKAIPLQAMYCWSPELAQRASRELDRTAFDLIHVEHLRGVQYGLHLKTRRARPAPPILWDSVDCISSLFEQAATYSRSRVTRAVTRFELPRTRRYETWLIRQFERTMVVSEIERLAFERLSRESSAGANERVGDKIIVLRTGVDLSFFAPFETEREPHTIVMTGKMSYHANVAAGEYLLTEIMPLVWREIPDAQVQIVGQNPPPHLAELAGKFSDRVQVVGSVPDIRPYLRRATMAVAPMVYCVGIQYKLLEAMATATPVVATPNSLAALAVQPGRDVLAGTDASQFAHQIVRLQSDKKLQREIGFNGRRYVESNHDWRQVAIELENVYHQVTQQADPNA